MPSLKLSRSYREHVQMFKDVVELKKPKRVPVCPSVGFYPFAYAGVTPEEAMYDYGKLSAALKKFHADFLPDSLAVAPLYGCGKALDILDYKLYRGEVSAPTERDRHFLSPSEIEAGRRLACQTRALGDVEAHIALGLSNVSFGLPARALVNRTFLTLALAIRRPGSWHLRRAEAGSPPALKYGG